MTAINTYAEAMVEIDAMIQEVLGDQPDVAEDDVANEIIKAFFLMNTAINDVNREVARCQLGWDEDHDKDLYQAHGITL